MDRNQCACPACTAFVEKRNGFCPDCFLSGCEYDTAKCEYRTPTR